MLLGGARHRRGERREAQAVRAEAARRGSSRRLEAGAFHLMAGAATRNEETPAARARCCHDLLLHRASIWPAGRPAPAPTSRAAAPGRRELRNIGT